MFNLTNNQESTYESKMMFSAYKFAKIFFLIITVNGEKDAEK